MSRTPGHEARSAALRALHDLPKKAPAEAVAKALGDLRAELSGADDLTRETAREDALRALNGKVHAPARFVDAALGERPAKVPESLQGQAVEFPAPEPWPEPVEGTDFLEEIRSTFERFVVLPPGAATALALWTVHSHAHEAADLSPLLVLRSPEKRCGKSTALTVLSALVAKPLTTSNITPASLFRLIEKYSPTVLIDEADSFLRMSDDLRGLLNSGHLRAGAFVVRTVGDEYEPRRFRTWAAKAIAVIGALPSTVEDRAIMLPMRRKTRAERVERLRLDRLEAETGALRRKAARWASDHLEDLRAADPDVPEALHDRAQDNWRPLLAIADQAGGDWPDAARRSALVLSSGEAAEDQSIGVELLSDIRQVFDENGAERLFTDELLEALHALKERPWWEWGRSRKPLSAAALARLLKRYEIKPRQMRIGEDNRKGYTREDFEDAFLRYTSPPDPKQAKQPNGDGPFPESPTRNTGLDVSGSEPPEAPLPAGDVSSVSRGSPGRRAWADV